MRAVPTDRRGQILGVTLLRRPADFGLLMTLGNLNPERSPATTADKLMWFQAAVAVRPNNSAARNNLGVYLGDKGNADGAIACYQEAIRLDPNNARAHNNLGFALSAKGDADGAIAEYREAIRIDPKNPLRKEALDTALKLKAERDAKVAPPPRAVTRP